MRQALLPLLLTAVFSAVAALFFLLLGLALGRRSPTERDEERRGRDEGQGLKGEEEALSSLTPRASPLASGPSPRLLFRLESVTKAYQDASGETIVVLNSVDLNLFDGQLTAVLGPSGKGKTTLLNLIGGLDTPDAGTIFFRGQALSATEDAALRKFRAEHVCYVFQELNLISHLTAEENSALPLLLRGVPRRKALAAARANLRALGMRAYVRRRPAQLSGGQRQRVAIARAFTADVDVILADEPSGSLDPKNARMVMCAFRRLSRLQRKPVVLVTHNVLLARKYCDRLLVCTARGFKDVTRPRTQLEQRELPDSGGDHTPAAWAAGFFAGGA